MWTALALSVPMLSACGGSPAEDLVIEPLPEVSPSLPNVPVIPPPPYPIQNADGPYSLYGVRPREGAARDTHLQGARYGARPPGTTPARMAGRAENDPVADRGQFRQSLGDLGGITLRRPPRSQTG